MRAWLKRRWLSFRIRRIRHRFEQLWMTKGVLELSVREVDQALVDLARTWREMRSQVDFLVPSTAVSAPTIPPSSHSCKPRLAGGLTARPASSSP